MNTTKALLWLIAAILALNLFFPIVCQDYDGEWKSFISKSLPTSREVDCE